VLHPHVAKTPGAIARFQREAQLMARLKHPGAVHLFDHGTDGEDLYLAMERVFGSPLDACRGTWRSPGSTAASSYRSARCSSFRSS